MAAHHLDVDDSVNPIGCHLCPNDFESKIICQPIVGWHLNGTLFTSGIVKHCESKLQKMLCRSTIGSPRWYGHLSNLPCGRSAGRTLKQRALRADFRRQESCYAGDGPTLGTISQPIGRK